MFTSPYIFTRTLDPRHNMPTPFCEHGYWWDPSGRKRHTVEPEWWNVSSSLVYSYGAWLCFRQYREVLNADGIVLIVMTAILGIGSALYHLNFQSTTLDLASKCVDEFAMIWLVTMAYIGFARTNFLPIAASLTWCFGMMAIDFAAVSDHRLDGGFEIGFALGIVALLVVVFRTTPPSHRSKNWKSMYAFSLVASLLAAAFWIPIETTCGSWYTVPTWAALAHSFWHFSTAYFIWNIFHFILLHHFHGHLRRRCAWFTWVKPHSTHG